MIYFTVFNPKANEAISERVELLFWYESGVFLMRKRQVQQLSTLNLLPVKQHLSWFGESLTVEVEALTC
jgi:hypothetical protein